MIHHRSRRNFGKRLRADQSILSFVSVTDIIDFRSRKIGPFSSIPMGRDKLHDIGSVLLPPDHQRNLEQIFSFQNENYLQGKINFPAVLSQSDFRNHRWGSRHYPAVADNIESGWPQPDGINTVLGL